MANDDKNAPKGFAGLDDLVSDIDAPAAKPVPAMPPRPFSPLKNPPALDAATPSPSPPQHPKPFDVNEAALNAKKPDKSNSTMMWVVGIGVVCLIILAANSSKKATPTYAAPSPPSYSKPAASVSQPPAPALDFRPLQASDEVEEQPPYGTGHTLSRNQIRYCLSEKIRLDGWRGAIDNDSSYSVEGFNIGVTDYNERCSSFRYRRGLLESVRGEVEVHRVELLQEGRDIAARSP